MFRKIAFCAVLLVATSLREASVAQSLVETPGEVGLSAQKLEEIEEYLQREVDAGRIAGAVAAVSRHGRVAYLQAVGAKGPGDGQAMESNSLFRIASMTKAITSASILSLVEEGRLSLEDPLSLHLPEFANPRVLKSIEGSSIETEPADREPTIHDLLTHRSGLTYGWFGPEKLDALYQNHNISNWFEPVEERIADRVERIAKLPLKFHPGSAWDYGVSSDVLGRVVEVVSGLTLEQFFRERFFRPLQMRDTFFTVPKEKLGRLAALYTVDAERQLRQVQDQPVQAGFLRFSADYCTRPGHFHSGGGGLVSSAADYLRFLNMLLGGGELDGVRVLEKGTVALMTRNQIGGMTIPFPGHGDGFGYGFGVVTDRSVGIDEFSVGSYSWGGIFNTYFWVDPQEQLAAVLMTQVFPNDHLQVRDDFRRLVYEAIDDSGFERLYPYQPGEEFANPYFSSRQLRVNAPETSTHPKFGARSEARSSGLARIQITEDLRNVRRIDLDIDVWGGHPGTANKRVAVNGRSSHDFPEVGTREHNCTHQHPSFNLRPMDLVNGYNSLQFACDQGDSFWGHYIVDRAVLRVGWLPQDERLKNVGLDAFQARVTAEPLSGGEEGFDLTLDLADRFLERIESVRYDARYYGYDDNGNGWASDWHQDIAHWSQPREQNPAEPTARSAAARWETTMLPAQSSVEVRAIVEFRDLPDVRYRTSRTRNLAVEPRADVAVKFFESTHLPHPFWSRNNQVKECVIDVDVAPQDIVAAELNVVAWTGGAGGVGDYFTLNGMHFAIAEGHEHKTVFSRIAVDPSLLKRGENRIVLHSDTQHHGIEVLLPGPALTVRYRTTADMASTGDSQQIDERHSLVCVELASRQSRDCYRIQTPTATFYLDRVGAGLASIVDRDGQDWLSFRPEPGSGPSGEYRGFPNAVFKEAGSYFHPLNSGTESCETKIEEVSPERVVISAVSDNGLWAGRYTFTASKCTFTMTKKPENHNYWVLYEGTPGGEYDDSDWWMTSADTQKRPLTHKHEGDIVGSEWIAFGDRNSPRMLILHHEEDDSHPDNFYAMQAEMTVFGFGRAGMKKYLETVPQSFSIGLVESTESAAAELFARSDSQLGDGLSTSREVLSSERRPTRSAEISESTALEQLGQYALTHTGDASAGRKLFHDARIKCAICHRLAGDGGQVGPDLSHIGGKLGRAHLIDSLLNPSREIGYGYETTIIVTADGRTFSGIAQQTDNLHIELIDANNNRIRLLRSEIEESRVSQASIMPTGLESSLSEQEFTDLITFLESLGPTNGKFGSGVTGPFTLPEGFELTTVATGLSGGVAMEVAPDGRIFVCEQGGNLRIIKEGKLLPKPFVSIPVEMNWERGLIGVTVAPAFPVDPYVYVVYVTDKPYTHHRISRFRADGDVAIAGSEEILLCGDDQSKFGGEVPAGHQGGAIHFGPDGKLYVGVGEQTAKTPAQQMNALQGKILRINADGSIPVDNPFWNETEGKYRSIWAKGCRNPFTFAFSETGEMLINDVGGKFEEINRGGPGIDLGWPTADHGPAGNDAFTDPIHIYPQSSINGGDFCSTASPWPQRYRGKYFFADFVQGWVKFIDPASPKESHEFLSGIRRPVDLRFAPDGSLYVLLRNAWVVDDKFEAGTGALVRIRAPL